MSGRVLVVDDIDINLRLLEAKLLSEYYDVLTASSGAMALDMACREMPDVILLDIMMPGMDGLEVCRRLRQEKATRFIPIVMVTALGDTGDRVRALELGADDFLTKPVNDTALFARVRSLIRLKRTLDEWRLREEINGRFASLPEAELEFDLDAAKPAEILILEDSEASSRKLTDSLRPLAGRINLVNRNLDAFRLATSAPFDLIVVSLALRADDPLRLVTQLRAAEATRPLPILLVIDEGDVTRLAKGLDLGASDYVVRPIDRDELVARARIQIRRKRLQDRLLDNLRRGLNLALIDSLTGLHNRRYLTAHLDTMFERPSAGKETAILMFDIDRFKSINDTYGHAVGDEVLIEIGRRALANVRSFDLVARYGGEEFIIVMPECSGAEACLVADRLCRSIAEAPVEIATPVGAVPVTVSVGVAVTGPDITTPEHLLANADRALYAAKHGGRNCAMLWNTDGGATRLAPTPLV